MLLKILRGMIDSYPAFQPPQAQIQIAGTLPPVLGNQAALTQCFSNLLGNAVKFAAPGNVPQVLVRAEPRGEFVRFWFEDNGIGIPPELHDRIFEMLQRVSKEYEGTGSWAITPCVNRKSGWHCRHQGTGALGMGIPNDL